MNEPALCQGFRKRKDDSVKSAFPLAAVFLAIVMSVISAGGAKAGQTYQVELKAGEVFSVCKSGLVVCPALLPICDDTNIIALVDTPDGLGFKGVAPGSTLCSVGTTVGPRRFFRITVH